MNGRTDLVLDTNAVVELLGGNAVLITRDHHFNRIPGLKIEGF